MARSGQDKDQRDHGLASEHHEAIAASAEPERKISESNSQEISKQYSTQEFIKKLQDATGNETLPKKFWEDYDSDAGASTFQDVLNEYAKYYKNLSLTQQEYVSKIFWQQIQTFGTPIIEARLGSDTECDVYFLMPKNKLAESEEEKAPA